MTAVHTNPEAVRSSSPPSLSVVKSINNNNSEKMVTTSFTDHNNDETILSKCFSRNYDNSKSPVKHKDSSPESSIKSGVVVSECYSRGNNNDGSQQDNKVMRLIS